MARPKGSKNKSTIAREQKDQECLDQLLSDLKKAGRNILDISGPKAWLEFRLRDGSTPDRERDKIALELMPYYHARKTENVNINNVRYMVALPNGEISMEDWLARSKPADKEAMH